MKLEVLIATMDLEDKNKLINDMNLNLKSSIIINQVKNKTISDISEGVSRLYSYQEKGLSKSRNRAIEHSKADICVIADDDIFYEDDYEKIIEEGYKKYPDADIIAFHVDNIDKKIQKTKRKEGKINFIKSMRIQSVQTTFKRNSIVNKNIKFNELFGAGTYFCSGEENIFLGDCVKKGLKIYYIPKTIATIQDNESTWMQGHDKQYFIAKGATFYELTGMFYPLFIIQFAIRKRKKYEKEITMCEAIRNMFEGVNSYKKERRRK